MANIKKKKKKPYSFYKIISLIDRKEKIEKYYAKEKVCKSYSNITTTSGGLKRSMTDPDLVVYYWKQNYLWLIRYSKQYYMRVVAMTFS